MESVGTRIKHSLVVLDHKSLDDIGEEESSCETRISRLILLVFIEVHYSIFSICLEVTI